MQVGTLTLVDLTADFAEVWERTRLWPGDRKVAAFKSHFAQILPGFYSHERFGACDRERYDGLIGRALVRYPEERAAIAAASRRFPGLLASALTSFQEEFGPLEGTRPVYLVHSLGEFDGGTRSLRGGRFLLFGADVIARLHLGHDPRPFLHHELFHLHHEPKFSHQGTVWCDLWCEGLATFAASRLNPGATDGELLLSDPEPIRPRVERDRPGAIGAVLERFDSSAPADREALFNARRAVAGLPPRVGYYIGYLALARIGEQRSLKAIADVPPEEARRLLRAALAELAAG